MKLDSDHDFAVMKVDGGPVVNSFLMQFQADILGRPVEVPVVTEMTAYGGRHFLSALAVGEFGSIRDVKRLLEIAPAL